MSNATTATATKPAKDARPADLPPYSYLTLVQSIPDPQRGVATFSFTAGQGYRIERLPDGWVVVTCPKTGAIVELPPSQVKELRRVPVPKDVA